MNEKMQNGLREFVTNYINQIESDLTVRWNLLEIDLSRKEVFEVLSGQLARQTTLAIQFASNSNCWTYDLAPVILRCMADNYINFAWIVKSPTDRAKKFILHGLGQEKLILEHRKNQILLDGGDPNKDDLIKMTEAWLNSRRYTFLTEINLGAWAGINTRQMAEEADCIDFYNYVYTPFSTVAHNMWGHIARYNLETSPNPLHKFLKKPFIGGYIDLYNIRLAAKYLDKMTRKFDEVFEINIGTESSYKNFLKAFSDFEQEFSKPSLDEDKEENTK